MTEQGDASVLMQAIDGEPSYLFLAVKKGTVEVVRAQLEAGGRELVMLTMDNGASCLMVSAHNGHLEVVRR
jgi:predicted LPLAT superfamily acyltransferase